MNAGGTQKDHAFGTASGLWSPEPQRTDRSPIPAQADDCGSEMKNNLGRRGAALAALIASTLPAASSSAANFAQGASLGNSQKTVLFLYPDEGIPGFVEWRGGPGWAEAAQQLAQRVRWDLDDDVELRVQSLRDFCAAMQYNTALDARLVVGVDLGLEPPPGCEKGLQAVAASSSLLTFLASSEKVQLGPFWRKLASVQGQSSQLHSDVADLWRRKSLDEAAYALLLLIDQGVQPVRIVRAQSSQPSVASLARTTGTCYRELLACLSESQCRRALSCLRTCGLADQSCAYQCLVSYESSTLTRLSFCAFQQEDVLNSGIERPDTPRVATMEAFRGKPLLHSDAEQILVGHLDVDSGTNYSWLVAAASSPAYAQFPVQYQIWVRGSRAGSLRYRPTFLVKTLSGDYTWKSRDYTVRRTDTPGQWEFSILDSGVMSEERWQLLGADDGLGWCALFFTGVARRAGLAYRGALLLTRDGHMPLGQEAAVEAALSRAGLRLWELQPLVRPSMVDSVGPAPLAVSR